VVQKSKPLQVVLVVVEIISQSVNQSKHILSYML